MIYRNYVVVCHYCFFVFIIIAMNDTLLVDLSGENPSVILGEKIYTIDRFAIETELTDVLLEVTSKYPIFHMYVVQWPGSFTVIRIGILIINTFIMTYKNPLNIYTVTKKQLRKNSFSHKNMYMFIGQKKNARHYHVANDTTHVISRSDIVDTATGLTDVKSLAERCQQLEFFSPYAIQSIAIIFKVHNTKKTVALATIPWEKMSTLQALYEIQPNIT